MKFQPIKGVSVKKTSASNRSSGQFGAYESTLCQFLTGSQPKLTPNQPQARPAVGHPSQFPEEDDAPVDADDAAALSAIICCRATRIATTVFSHSGL